MIIYLASFPRSGNTWIRTLLFESFRILSSSVYQEPENTHLLTEVIDSQFCFPTFDEQFRQNAYTRLEEFILSYNKRFLSTYFSDAEAKFLEDSPLQELIISYEGNYKFLVSGSERLLRYPLIRQYLATSGNIFIIKTHERPFNSYFPGEKIIQIVRNPGAVFWSYLHYLKDFDGIETTLEDIIFGKIGYGDWSLYHQLWMIRSRELMKNFCRISYEDLAKDSRGQITRISDFIKIPVIGAGEVSFLDLHNSGPVFFREGKASQWEKNYTIYQLNQLWNKHKVIMSLLDYSEPNYKLALDANLIGVGEKLKQLEINSTEKKLEIQLTRANDQIFELTQKIEKHNEIVKEYEDRILNSNETIALQETQLIEKEQVIQQLALFSRTSLRYLVENRLFPIIRKSKLGTLILDKILLLKYIFSPRVFVLDQYPPREFNIPKYYQAKTVEPIRGSQPKVSIVTPSFNQANFLERTIVSVISQEYPNIEYVVQDGGSKDGSIKILEKYSKSLANWVSEPDNGQSHGINLGFEKTTGEVMAYLNSDDIYLPDAVQYVVNYFEKNPGVDVVYSHRIIIDEKDQDVGVWMLPKHDTKSLYFADFIPQETLFWRRRIWEKVGGIDETFNFAMDWDLLLRFQDSGAKIVRLPRFLAAFRVHTNQKTFQHISEIGMQEMEKIQSRYFDDIDQQSIYKNMKPYIRRATLHHLLYRMNLLRV